MTFHEMPIRPARLDDAPEVARLSAAFAAYLSSLGDECPGPLTEEAYRRDGFGPRRCFSGLVASAGDRLCGYLLHHPGYDVDLCAPITHVIDLFVDPSVRRQGVGRRLIEAVAKEAHEAGSIRLVWGVYRANRLAYAFYERLGAQHIADLTLMRLSINEDN
ncbi:MAG TPA: GNAT family N-acetyltransferase [Alphaproteobacteria bacterium]|nr:GNAT family N-acetyltransferase [Alphaproteobacteria bacterium]